jgi:prolipoprotein diacylglyceryltransferase
VTFDPRTPAGVASQLVGPLHPVQLYEAAGLLAIAGAGWLLARFAPPRARGALFALYVGLYALLRLATEGLRGDFVERGSLVPGLSTSQALALAMLAAAAALLWILHRRSPKGVVA